MQLMSRRSAMSCWGSYRYAWRHWGCAVSVFPVCQWQGNHGLTPLAHQRNDDGHLTTSGWKLYQLQTFYFGTEARCSRLHSATHRLVQSLVSGRLLSRCLLNCQYNTTTDEGTCGLFRHLIISFNFQPADGLQTIKKTHCWAAAYLLPATLSISDQTVSILLKVQYIMFCWTFCWLLTRERSRSHTSGPVCCILHIWSCHFIATTWIH